MKEIFINELSGINGGVSVGVVTFALVTGLVTSGPVGFGIAACGIIGAKGIDNLAELSNSNKKTETLP